LLEKTLEITGEEMGEGHFPTVFFEGISSMVAGNELIALRCLSKVMGDERMGSHISLCEKHIDAVFRHVVKLPEEYANVAEIWKEAMQLADALGRLRVYKFRWVYEELCKKI
jgi:hypothetical protein